jgi:hypothetical protein
MIEELLQKAWVMQPRPSGKIRIACDNPAYNPFADPDSAATITLCTVKNLPGPGSTRRLAEFLAKAPDIFIELETIALTCRCSCTPKTKGQCARCRALALVEQIQRI